VNEGIVEAHRNGVLTATTLMANGGAFDDAVRLARETPSLDIGMHLVLVQGRSVLHSDKEFPETLQDLAKALLRREIHAYDEAAAQVRKILAAGLQPSHLDTHKHTHLFPAVLDAVARIAKEFGIPWVRRPFDYGTGPVAGLTRQAVGAAMKLMSPSFAKKLAGFRMTDHFTGFQLTGALNTGAMLETLKTLPPGLTEFMCHPGHCGAELRAAATRLKESRAAELAALTSPEVRRVIEECGIELTCYRALKAKA
jgi:predicted glycoside hydrolase/deacetylase ChbG (UPF0249 family)